jgi:DNA mismatch endonuclease (patch repair protein)
MGAARAAVSSELHMADNLTPEQRSRTMSRIRSTNTQVELTIRRMLHQRGLRYRLHVGSLPGKPDIVFPKAKVVVFVDGDFWHGWRFAQWEHKLQPYWRDKIAGNRRRDRLNFQRLRRQGWTVIRLWEHDVKRDAQACVERVVAATRLASYAM